MEQVRGSGRGSYIFGRSVHNIRIERLWVDWTTGVGKKWATFFYELEYEEGLCPDNIAHLWLLHHLFLPALNRDALEWADAWNSHKTTIDGERRQSPREMFMFGLLEDGPRGIGHLGTPLPAAEGEVGDVGQFGVDWEAQATPARVNHLAENNVVVEPPNCPFALEEVNILDVELARVADIVSRDMAARKVVWREALGLCHRFYE
ncbi:hypothetical protein B0H14DRAFT_3082554 [Mycena olivaceomarginata]|nr:hypothetical protein B0H14DRAFT_3082554 [Mycena olivaceomarginata]